MSQPVKKQKKKSFLEKYFFYYIGGPTRREAISSVMLVPVFDKSKRVKES